jgi:hypothetical protein
MEPAAHPSKVAAAAVAGLFFRNPISLAGHRRLARAAAAEEAQKAAQALTTTAAQAAHPVTSRAAQAEPQAAHSTARQALPASAHDPALEAAAGLLTARLQRLVTAAAVAHPAVQAVAVALA